jgi:hypothetical protein
MFQALFALTVGFLIVFEGVLTVRLARAVIAWLSDGGSGPPFARA